MDLKIDNDTVKLQKVICDAIKILHQNAVGKPSLNKILIAFLLLPDANAIPLIRTEI